MISRSDALFPTALSSIGHFMSTGRRFSGDFGVVTSYYAAFVLDPDGNNIEAGFRG